MSKELVNHPIHYGGADNTYEVIKVIEAWGLDFCLGNTIKYISRAGKKDDEIQDLKKALWYLNRRIEALEGMAMAEDKVVDKECTWFPKELYYQASNDNEILDDVEDVLEHFVGLGFDIGHNPIIMCTSMLGMYLMLKFMGHGMCHWLDVNKSFRYGSILVLLTYRDYVEMSIVADTYQNLLIGSGSLTLTCGSISCTYTLKRDESAKI